MTTDTGTPLVVVAAPPLRHGWLKFIVKDLETNPRTQYKVHLYGVIYWLINFPLIIALFFGAPTLWLKLGIFITLIYSIYANFATDYGSMSAAMAAFAPAGQALPALPLESPAAAAHYAESAKLLELQQRQMDLLDGMKHLHAEVELIRRTVAPDAPQPPGGIPRP